MIRPSVKVLKKWLAENEVDAIITNGPPHSVHLIGLHLKQATGLPWLADFRDPWTTIDFRHKLPMTPYAIKRNQLLEKEVLQNADCVTCVSPSWAADLEKIGNRNVEVIYNGYDSDDFPISSDKLGQHFTITHIGSMNDDRNPTQLWRALGELRREHKGFSHDLQIEFYGLTDFEVFEHLEKNGLKNKTQNHGFLPHCEMTTLLSTKAILLLSQNRTDNVMGIIPGKLFEYLASKRPILTIGHPDGDLSLIHI